jgi:hypothetical protein
MGTLSVSVPDTLREKMAQLDDINWSAVARKAFEEKVEQIEFITKLASKSKLTQKDADEVSRKINMGMANKFRGM